MCKDEYRYRTLVVTSQTERSHRRESCNINNGYTHWHVIEVENLRHESAFIVGRTFTHSPDSDKQIYFIKGNNCSDTWEIATQFTGSERAILDRSEINIQSVHSATETIVTEIYFSYDDIFFQHDPDPFRLFIKVNFL